MVVVSRVHCKQFCGRGNCVTRLNTNTGTGTQTVDQFVFASLHPLELTHVFCVSYSQ